MHDPGDHGDGNRGSEQEFHNEECAKGHAGKYGVYMDRGFIDELAVGEPMRCKRGQDRDRGVVDGSEKPIQHLQAQVDRYGLDFAVGQPVQHMRDQGGGDDLRCFDEESRKSSGSGKVNPARSA